MACRNLKPASFTRIGASLPKIVSSLSRTPTRRTHGNLPRRNICSPTEPSIPKNSGSSRSSLSVPWVRSIVIPACRVSSRMMAGSAVFAYVGSVVTGVLTVGSSWFVKRSLANSISVPSPLTLGTLGSLSLGLCISVSLDSHPVTVSRLWQGAFCNLVSGFTHRVEI